VDQLLRHLREAEKALWKAEGHVQLVKKLLQEEKEHGPPKNQ
jgi:hypothetical protein